MFLKHLLNSQTGKKKTPLIYKGKLISSLFFFSFIYRSMVFFLHTSPFIVIMLGAASVEELMQVACVWILQRTRRRRQCIAPPYPTVQSTNHNTLWTGLTRTRALSHTSGVTTRLKYGPVPEQFRKKKKRRKKSCLGWDGGVYS